MDELIKTFHIDIKLLIAQLVNFIIVLLVLWKFAYKPILKIMNERSNKIEKGLRAAEETQKKLQEMTQKEKEVLAGAKKEAQEIIAKAEDTAKKSKEQIEVEAKEQAEKIVSDAKIQIETEKQKLLREAKAEIGDLVVAATEKMIGEKLDRKKNQDLIDRIIK